MTEMTHVTEESFEAEVLKSSLPVLVDFSAVWCGPCKMLDPIVKQLAAGEWDGKAKAVKVDADQCPGIVGQYGVMSIPTLILFKGGQAVERVSGYQPKDKLIKKFGPHL